MYTITIDLYDDETLVRRSEACDEMQDRDIATAMYDCIVEARSGSGRSAASLSGHRPRSHHTSGATYKYDVVFTG